MMDDEFIEISAHDLQSTLAGKIRRHIDGRIKDLRALNDSDQDPFVTAKLRGQIKAYKNLKNLLALEKPLDPEMVADDK